MSRAEPPRHFKTSRIVIARGTTVRATITPKNVHTAGGMTLSLPLGLEANFSAWPTAAKLPELTGVEEQSSAPVAQWAQNLHFTIDLEKAKKRCMLG